MLNLPGVEYLYVAINQAETIVFAKWPGLVPKILRLLVDSRTAIRKKQAVEKEPFVKSVYDKMQLAMKTTCNPTDGFFGAGNADALFPVKEIMYSTTSIGRYLQRKCVHYLGSRYQIPTVYGDTDSVFVIAKLPENQSSIEAVADGARTMYDMGPDFSWQTVVDHFKQLPVATWSRVQQEHALLYLIFEKLSAECTKLFPPPIVLGFENLLVQLAMYDTKKTYYGLALDEKNPSRVAKTKVTGMAMKKRDWCPFTRTILKETSRMLLYGELDRVKPYLEASIQRLMDGQVPLDQLTITKLFKGKDAYKSMNAIHTQLVLKLEKRQRIQYPPSRIPFVVIQGSEKLYNRGEEPARVQEEKIPLDLRYYLLKQLEKPLRKQLFFHPSLVNVDRFFLEASQRMDVRQQSIGNVFEASGKRRMTMADFIEAKKRKRGPEK
jgi:DNA polymerase elongation subunit (family B)